MNTFQIGDVVWLDQKQCPHDDPQPMTVIGIDKMGVFVDFSNGSGWYDPERLLHQRSYQPFAIQLPRPIHETILTTN